MSELSRSHQSREGQSLAATATDGAHEKSLSLTFHRKGRIMLPLTIRMPTKENFRWIKTKSPCCRMRMVRKVDDVVGLRPALLFKKLF